jgi:acetyl-CoA acetyltransferase
MNPLLHKDALIVGVGEFGYSRDSGVSEEILLANAVREALADAGMEGRCIDGIILADSRLALRPWVLAESLRTDALRVVATSSSAGASGTAWGLREAAKVIDSGYASSVILYFGRNQASQPERMSPFNIHAEDIRKGLFELPYGWFPQTAYFASMLRRQMHDYDLRPEDLGLIALQMRKNGAHHPLSVPRSPLTMDAYMESRYIVEPLRAADMSLVTDGAGALVITSSDVSKGLPGKAVKVLASSEGHSSDYYFAQGKDFNHSSAMRQTRDIYSLAQIVPEDIDVVLLYDAFTVMVSMQLEGLGFCEQGDVGPYLREGGGSTMLKKLNPNGGLLGQAHVSGINNLIEGVRQLRNEAGERQLPGARLALFSGMGWFDHYTVVLSAN